MPFSHKLMENNITNKDVQSLLKLLKKKKKFLHNQKMLLLLKRLGQNG